MFKLISLLRDVWQLRAENSALKSRVDRLERERGTAPEDPHAARDLAQVRGELETARRRLARIREIVFRTHHKVERGVTHVQ
ncbi:MAG: hypothetical protein AAB434_03875 [Planctomycetota bacterium]